MPHLYIHLLLFAMQQWADECVKTIVDTNIHNEVESTDTIQSSVHIIHTASLSSYSQAQCLKYK